MKKKFNPQFRQGEEFNIAGINHIKGMVTFGDFEGYIKPDTGNRYDPHAIAIYSNEGDERIGYLPKSPKNQRLFNAMLKQDVILYASGYVSEFENDRGEIKKYGKVYLNVEW